MGEVIRAHDWAATPLGPIASWSSALRTALSIMLDTRGLGTILWGPELRLLYNDLYAETLGDRHPAALGRPMMEVWGDTTAPVLEAFMRVYETGEGFRNDAVELPFWRDGRWQTTYWDASVSPIRDDASRIVGLFNLALETTKKVMAERLRFGLADLGEQLRLGDDVDTIRAAACEIIGRALDASRVGYGHVARNGKTFTVPGDWVRTGFPTLAGTYSLDDYGAYASDLRAGRTVVIDDVTVDPRTGTTTEQLLAVHVGSLINYPIIEHGRIVATLYVNDPGPRQWQPDEIAFVREAGDRLRQVSERRHAELALRDLNETLEERIEERSAALRLYRDIVQSNEAPIVAFDRDMRITAFNKAHAEAYRQVYDIDQRAGDSLLEQFVPGQVEALRGFMQRALAGESFTVRAAFGDPALDVPDWEIAYNPLRDDNGDIVGGFHQAIDITAELSAQRELERTQDALRQSQKMEAIGQLTGGVAHDFNNLLTVIRGSVDLLRRDDLPVDRRRRYLDAIGDTADRAAKLTGQLLAFARRQTLEPETFDVGRRIDAITDMLASITGARVTIRFALPDADCRVRADVSQFETALVNLAVNARDAMEDEGSITIALRCDATLPAIRGHAGGTGAFVAVSLTDNGKGIAVDDLERIFEPFFTTKEVGKGTGLGLSQVFGFAKQSGGDIDVTSVVGEGSTFTLYLPAVESEPDPSRSPATTTAPQEGRGKCVLVVEDNVAVGQFATQLLDDLGYRTRWVMNAEEALAQLGADGAGYDIVFSDVVMPGMGGIELAKRIAQDLPHLPVVLASGYSHVLVQEGVDGVRLLRKPYSASQLSAVLQQKLAAPT